SSPSEVIVQSWLLTLPKSNPMWSMADSPLSRLAPLVVLKQEQYATRASDAQPLHAISQVISFFAG
ncbi:MAG: hypothetical protein ABR568_16005, partial [Pyrinomonadaceae bacterium]